MNNQAWDVQEVRIGSAVRGNGGAPRQTVARTQSAVNAAKRAGTFVGTEKKFATGNAVKGPDGQRLTKVDRSDDIVKPKTVGPAVAAAILKARNELGLTRKELAGKCFVSETQLATYENGKASPDQKVLGALERTLKVKLRGADIGAPAPVGTKKAADPAPAKGKKGNKAKEEKGVEKGEEKKSEEGKGKEDGAQVVKGDGATEAKPADGDTAQEQT